jgi:hypothetical protein
VLCFLVISDVLVDSEALMVTSLITRIRWLTKILIEDLQAQSSKNLIGVGFACVRS